MAASDQHLYALDFDPGQGFSMTGPLTGPVATGTSPSAFTLGDNARRIYWVAAADRSIHALDFDNGQRFSTMGPLTGPVRALRGRVFHAGDRLIITITIPGQIAERARIRFRDGRRPLASLLRS